jgi:hypothetical protein
MPLFDLKKYKEDQEEVANQRLLEENIHDSLQLIRDIRNRHTSCRYESGIDLRCSWCRKADEILTRKEVA